MYRKGSFPVLYDDFVTLTLRQVCALCMHKCMLHVHCSHVCHGLATFDFQTVDGRYFATKIKHYTHKREWHESNILAISHQSPPDPRFNVGVTICEALAKFMCVRRTPPLQPWTLTFNIDLGGMGGKTLAMSMNTLHTFHLRNIFRQQSEHQTLQDHCIYEGNTCSMHVCMHDAHF